MNLLETSELQKSNGEFKVIKNLSFDIKENEILGLHGPNGAGKSKTINILATVLNVTAGDIKFLSNGIIKN